jgi:large subunit ribosomal protein L2
MGKRIISQRRGRGTSTYRTPGHRFVSAIFHRSYDDVEKTSVMNGVVKNFLKCPGHTAPLAEIEYENGDRGLTFATLGIHTGKKVQTGKLSKVENGNTVPLKSTKIGTIVYNIESKVGDGGKYIRSAGSFATVVGKTRTKVSVKMPSKKIKLFDVDCRATVGIVAGGGRKDKPIVKAGKRHFIMKARNRLYPQTSGVAMNAVDHPFGSGRGRHMGKPRTVSRHAPPGRKVGSISPKRTGKK